MSRDFSEALPVKFLENSLMMLLIYSVKDIFHDRISLPARIYRIATHCIVETRDSDHMKELRQSLLEAFGDDLLWNPGLDERFIQ